MKRIFLSMLCFLSCTQLYTSAVFPAQIRTFYEQYICQTKQLLSTVGLTTPCVTGALQAPPPNPTTPPFMGDLLPIVFTNNSGLPDDQVFILVTGRDENNPLTQSFISFDSSGAGTRVNAVSGDNGSNYTKSLAQLPATQGGHVVYLPKVSGGLIWFSLNQKLNMPVNAQNQIIQPDFANPSDPNYNTIFDIFELAYVSTGVQIVADATAVSFFGIPLYGFISTPAPGTLSNTGLFNSRSSIFAYATTLFNLAVPPANTEWNKLILRNATTGQILRLLSTGKAMAVNLFDPNYLDNAARYGFSYLQDIWTGPTSFYRQHPLLLTIPNGSLETYTGVINPNNTITFTSAPSGYQVVLSAPSNTFPLTTSRQIFSGEFFIASDNSPGMADGIQINKLFEEAIIAGLVPTTSTISEPYLKDHQTNFYTINPFLSPAGQTSGPWYDLYSKVLHDQGFIYTYAFDEPLWPQVQIFSQTFVPNETYLGVTIGNVVS